MLSTVPLLALAHEDETIEAFADRCGVSPRSIVRWRNGAAIRIFDADRIAYRLGFHPCEIWHDNWWTIANDVKDRGVRDSLASTVP